MIVTAVTRYRRAGREPLPLRAAERAGEGHVLTTEEYLLGAVEWGTCLHRAMRTLAHSADVVIGNYNHQSFDLLVSLS